MVELYKSQNALTRCYNCQKFGHVWANCIETVWRRGMHLQHWHTATASWLKERQHILPTTVTAGMLRKNCG
jgi:hypothetical protein